MQHDHYLILASILVGIGIGSALSRRNIIAIIMSVTTAGAGVVIAMSTFHVHNGRTNDGMLFALCIGAILLVFIVLGCALAYRRFMSSGATNITEGNRLRH